LLNRFWTRGERHLLSVRTTHDCHDQGFARHWQSRWQSKDGRV
jgi:hypothetical protein